MIASWIPAVTWTRGGAKEAGDVLLSSPNVVSARVSGLRYLQVLPSVDAFGTVIISLAVPRPMQNVLTGTKSPSKKLI